jgi:hypothetical protein
MKLFVLVAALFLALPSARVVQPWSDDYNITNVVVAAGDEPERILYLPYPYATDDFYNECKCKGENFWNAMHSSSADAGNLFKPARSSSESIYTEICKRAVPDSLQ